MMKKIFPASVALLVTFGIPLVSLAAAACTGNSLCNPLGFDKLEDFLRAILHLVVMIGFPVIVLFIVFLGFKFIAAEGKPEEIDKVKKLFFWAIVGSLIVLGAEALAIAIQGTVKDLSNGVT